MCESTVYVRKDGGEEILMSEVASVRPEGGKLVLCTILGERIEFDGSIEEIDLMGHKILLRRRQAVGCRQ